VGTNSTDPLIGRLIDGRYQVRSRIARGGMATVYLATDLRLERRVAIKVMHGHLADDTQYKARFIQEARSAARLAHPNVVNVYDQGQDAETAYLVMEYLPGITLRDLLQEHHILTTDQTLDIMEAVLSGLAAAHRNGIVHRDLKPENVLLADDGRIKIGDFGLARAATANTATGNALLGTIAYLSPELVTRGVADTRSDIYSVGIMLYEMLAGEQPFKGEQAFQIAQQHATDTVPTPSTKNPRVPAELDELVLWATAREPDQRPRDATVMLEQLLETQELLRSPAAGTPVTGVQRTRILPTVAATSAATQVISSAARPRTGPVIPDKSSALTLASERRHRRGFWLFALVILLAALGGGTGWYFGSGPGAQVSIPNVSGATVKAATAKLAALDLTVSTATSTGYSTEIAKGLVLGTTPPPGTHVAHDVKVTLVTSLGPKPLPVPKLVGQTEAAALAAIEAGHFTTTPSEFLYHQKVAKQKVIAAHGTDHLDLTTVKTYGEEQPITLVVSLGPIPNVAGLSVNAAQDKLAEAELTGVASFTDWSDTVPAGDVIRAQLQKDAVSVAKGGKVDLVISKGVRQVPVPEVEGMTWRQAQKILTDQGFDIEFKNPISEFLSSVPDNSTVKSIDPHAGKLADKGATVTVALQAG
jgi:eukaryotic-like serine/threonine-protein kinase